MQRVKKDDLVQVISGNETGTRGRVEEVIKGWYVDKKTHKRLRRDGNIDKVRVEGVNVRKKHRKRTAPNVPGEIVEITMPVHISNVMVVCPSCDEAVRVGFRVELDKKVRYCKKCNSNFE